MKKWAVGFCQGDVSRRAKTLSDVRKAAMNLEGELNEIKRFDSIEQAKVFLKTRKNDLLHFESAGMWFYNARVFWLYEILIDDEDQSEEIGEWLEAAEWTEED